MADTRQRTTWGNRFRFLARALGLTGLLVAGFGIALLYTVFRDNLDSLFSVEQFSAVGRGAHGEFAKNAALVAGVGAGVALLVLLFELLSGIILGSGRRTAAGSVATLGIVAAVVLLVLVNVYSFTHYKRFDGTRDQRFTLPPNIAADLGTLRGKAPTTIVVLQKHRMFGTLTDERDAYTKAAEEKVTEKVKDLVDQFREFGPQFNVVVLDTEAFGYKDHLDDLTKDAPELKAAIDAAPENSILFHANKRVQRLSFNEFMQLDKTASKAAQGSENLVLIPQGIETFARRILAVHERRPKVAVCVVHEWLSSEVTEGTKQFTVAGLKKSLTDNGFDVVDIVLKKNWEDSTKELEPAAYTLEESKLERLEAEADSARDAVRAAQDDVKLLVTVQKAFDEVQKEPLRDRVDFYNELQRGAQLREWTELIGAYRKWAARGPAVNEENEKELAAIILAGLKAQSIRAEEQVKEAEADQREAKAKVDAALADERTVEDRRIADVKAKLTRLIADVDLLIVPRHTLMNVSIRSGIPPSLYPLDKKQVEVVKEFMKAGKPVLACLGPVSTPTGPLADANDGFEKLLNDRGIELGRDTILFDSERKALAAVRAGGQITGSGPTAIPPLVFAADPPADSKLQPNPIATALRLTGRTVEQKLDIQLLAPRPVYLARGWQEKMPFAAEFIFTTPNAWNEERPFITTGPTGRVTYFPRYDPTPADDPKRNTWAEERKASFPIAVAIESKIPASWVNEEYERQQAVAGLLVPLDSLMAAGLTVAANKLDRPTQRTVVFGSGHIFSGPKLEAPQEKLLLHTVNWLTNRQDRLPKPATAETPAWQYPRVAMSERNRDLWRIAAWAGLPLVVAYLGLLAMMIRRMR